MSQYQIITADAVENFVDITDAIMPGAFPKFLNYNPAVINHWKDLYRLFAEDQFALQDLSDNRVVAFGNCFPIRWDGPFEYLPEGGFEWAITAAVAQAEAGIPANTLCAFQIVVRDDLRNMGLSYQVVKTMVEVVRSHQFSNLIAPVRPNRKCNYPLMDFAEYVASTRPDGQPVDDWIRVHVKLGGEVLHPCHRSMVVDGTRENWLEWCGIDIAFDGPHVPAGGLAPLEVRADRKSARYVEPNLWIRHSA
jgi:GNAT superfamily N-acetyltransferase